DADDRILDIVKEVLIQTHSAVIYDGWITLEHWYDNKFNVRGFLVVLAANVVMFTSLGAAITVATRTYQAIVATTTLSNKNITIQHTLLKAVYAQAIVPVFCVYLPYFLLLTCPFLKIPVFSLADNFSLLISIFPGWDALVIILLVKDYRIGLARMFGFSKPQKIVVLHHTQFTTSIQSTVI
ncbi:hypothetical protein PMAYCL1PPCAC_16628, partial [Pristionchus mayeri]